MKFYKHLYFSENIRENRRKIVYKLKHRKYAKDIYVLALATAPGNILDIYSANTLLQPYYKKHDIEVVGIASGNDEAMELAASIIGRMYAETNGFNIRQYLGYEITS